MVDGAKVNPLEPTEAEVAKLFPDGWPNASELIALILEDVFLCGGTCTVSRRGDWWIVSSSKDWLVDDSIPAIDLFHRIVAAPRVGPNAVRSEYVVTRSSVHVATSTDDGWQVVIGELDDALRTFEPSVRDTRRSIAFRV